MAPPRQPRAPRPGGEGRGGGRPARKSTKSTGRPAAPKAAGQARGRDDERGRRNPREDTRKDPRKGSRNDGRPRKSADGRAKRPERRNEPEPPASWGGVARRGAGRLRDSGTSKAAAAWREASGRPEPQEEWVRVDDVRSEASDAVARGTRRARPERTAETPRGRTRKPPPAVADELARTAGASQAPKLGQRLAEASRAFERERFIEARSLLKTLAQRAPGSPAVRELYGLTLYRLGQWRSAMRELEAFAAMTGSTEQHPVLADCARALKQWTRVNELWEELKAASPGPELVAEGRIVAAGALADRGKLREAIELLEPAATRMPKKPREHHLRLLYALADLRERAGEVPAARTLFRRLQSIAPDFADVNQRVRALG